MLLSLHSSHMMIAERCSGRLRRAPNVLYVIRKYTKKFAEVVFSLRVSLLSRRFMSPVT